MSALLDQIQQDARTRNIQRRMDLLKLIEGRERILKVQDETYQEAAAEKSRLKIAEWEKELEAIEKSLT